MILHLVCYALTGTTGLIKSSKYIPILGKDCKFECLAFGSYKTEIINRKMLVGWNTDFFTEKYFESICKSVCLKCCSTLWKGTSILFEVFWPLCKIRLCFVLCLGVLCITGCHDCSSHRKQSGGNVQAVRDPSLTPPPWRPYIKWKHFRLELQHVLISWGLKGGRGQLYRKLQVLQHLPWDGNKGSWVRVS